MVWATLPFRPAAPGRNARRRAYLLFVPALRVLPGGAWRLGGLVYPRLGQRGRLFWCDLHSVTGLWISIVTLFMLLSGMPWSATWGSYLTWARNHWSVTAGTPD